MSAAAPLEHRKVPLMARLHLPRRTIRLRLAVLYGGLFFVSGAAVLALTYAGVSHTHAAYVRAVHIRPGGLEGPEVSEAIPGPTGSIKVLDPNQRSADLRVLAFVSVIALAIMAIISMALGWWIAGRVLRPLRTITSAARDISATNLHRRLALDGPDDEFKELGDTFDGLLGRLDASFQSQRQFVANASHELRTPLARLKTLAQVALADPDASVGSLRAAHERVLASELQLEELIGALLSLASSERGLERRESIDLTAVTEEAIATRREEIERQGLELNTSLQGAHVRGDRRLIERLVANLLENAISHNTTAGRIDIGTATAAAGAILSVANSGRVIAPADLEGIQQPFGRLGAERTNQGDGHGLGLSIVGAIARAHQANLSIRAQPDGGLDIQVSFPVQSPGTPAKPD
ncbi:MAG TPA: ATP-binding protein [Solirubrobacteraceae bacterium]